MKGFILSGTGSGVGKTSVATGLMSRLSKTMEVQAFKAGPPLFRWFAPGN